MTALFKRRDHETENLFYVAPRRSLNLLSYPNMQRLELYNADVEAVNAISTKHPSTSKVKTDTVVSLQNSFPEVFKTGSATPP